MDWLLTTTWVYWIPALVRTFSTFYLFICCSGNERQLSLGFNNCPSCSISSPFIDPSGIVWVLQKQNQYYPIQITMYSKSAGIFSFKIDNSTWPCGQIWDMWLNAADNSVYASCYPPTQFAPATFFSFSMFTSKFQSQGNHINDPNRGNCGGNQINRIGGWILPNI